MNISRPFILRPVATTLLTFAVFLAGAAAYALLPVSSLPQVDIPTIAVSANLPGASPEVVAATVATPLERHLGEIADVTEMTSRSSIGQTQIVLQFGLHRDLDGAARDVQAAIEAARADLPSSLRSNPSYRKFNPAAAPIMVLTLVSKTRTQGQLYDLASNVLQPALSQVNGVGNVQISGSSLPAIRVELNPRALFKYGIGLADVRAALAAGNANTPKGAIEVGERRYQIYANDVLTSDVDKGAALYGSLIIASRNGAVVRLSDVAEVQGSVEDIRNAAYCDGEPCVVLQVSQQPGANLIDTVDHIAAQIPRLQSTLPVGVQLQVRNDQTAVIRTSLRDTGRTLVISVILVIMIVYLFLRSWRAAIIPCVAVPVSLVGTFGIMYLFGFTLDNISLMALTVATGFVVDDAIVVLENTSRHVEAGMPRLQAALLGAKEVAFTVLSMTVSLCAVFLPVPLIGGPIGQLFKEFVITMSAALFISLVISLTTTPMLCALLLRPDHGAEKGRFKRWLDGRFDRLVAAYQRSLKLALENGGFVMFILGIVLVLNFHLYSILPKGYFPWMDQGRIQGGVRGDQSASFELTRTKVEAFEKILRADPAVESVQLTTGGNGGGGGGGFVSVTLKPRAERKLDTEQVINRMRPMLAEVPGANMFLFTPQDIRVGGRQGNSPFQYTLLSDDVEALREWAPKLEAALKDVPQLQDVSTDQSERGLETEISIDRDTASRLGLTTSQVANALQDAFAQRSVSTIYNQFNQYHVIMEVAKEFWQSPETLQDLFISTFGQISGTQATAAVSGTTSAGGDAASTAGAEAVRNQATNRLANSGRGAASTGAAVSTRVETMVPFAALSKYSSGRTPTSVNHQGHFAAVTVSFSVAQGYSLSDVTKVIPQVANEIGLPPSIHGVFAGTAGAFQASASTGPLLILAAIITVYIVLGILYESYIHPLTIISTLPSAGIGAFILLGLMKMELGLIALIGLILLIGIVKKNAIIMVDFAIQAQRERGLSHRDAIFEASVLRFRPIMMTSAAAILGALPLAIGFGEGSELRQPLGVTILGGLLASQVLTIYTTPVIYLYLARFGAWVTVSRKGFAATIKAWFARRKAA